MYSEHLDNSVTDIVTNIEQVKIQRILNGSHSLNDIGIVSSSKPESPAAPVGSEIVWAAKQPLGNAALGALFA